MRESIEVRRLAAQGRQGIAVKVVIAACAASAGAHGGLVPEHLREAPRLGIAFILASVLLLAVVAAFALCPEDRRIARRAGEQAGRGARRRVRLAARSTSGRPQVAGDSGDNPIKSNSFAGRRIKVALAGLVALATMIVVLAVSRFR